MNPALYKPVFINSFCRGVSLFLFSVSALKVSYRVLWSPDAVGSSGDNAAVKELTSSYFSNDANDHERHRERIDTCLSAARVMPLLQCFPRSIYTTVSQAQVVTRPNGKPEWLIKDGNGHQINDSSHLGDSDLTWQTKSSSVLTTMANIGHKTQ